MSELRTNRIVPRDGLPSGSSGGIIQVRSTTKTDGDFNTSSSSFVDVTGLSVTITPTRSDSKILIFATVHGVGNSSTQAYFRFMRNSTPICVGTSVGGRVAATMGSLYEDQENDVNSCSQNFLDSPSTTSAVTYKIQTRTQGAGTLFINRSRSDHNNATSGRFTSTITVMEVSG
tara:strand:+ start:187 stop:708 length:522 start_codon:yes stop_codon:yes gene_type:complete